MKRYAVNYEVKKRCPHEGLHVVVVEAANAQAAKKKVVETVWTEHGCHAFHAEARVWKSDTPPTQPRDLGDTEE